jgi:hypothetical protein
MRRSTEVCILTEVGKQTKKGEENMKMKWMVPGVAALLLLTGCDKGTNTNQTASNPPTATTTPNQAEPTQGSQTNPASPTNPTNTPAAVPTPTPEPPKPFEIATGTSIPIILSSTINSRVNKPGEDFQGSLAAPITVDGEEAIPKGASVQGTIVDAKKQGTFKGEANLAIRLTSITVRGKVYPITTSMYSGTQKGKGKRTAVVTGGGAALGALIGGLAGGGKGAAIGAGVGGGGGLAASGATGGKNVEFPAETRITFKLSHAITVER